MAQKHGMAAGAPFPQMQTIQLALLCLTQAILHSSKAKLFSCTAAARGGS